MWNAEKWWELPKYPYRPQLLQLSLTAFERQPADVERRLQAVLAGFRW